MEEIQVLQEIYRLQEGHELQEKYEMQEIQVLQGIYRLQEVHELQENCMKELRKCRSCRKPQSSKTNAYSLFNAGRVVGRNSCLH